MGQFTADQVASAIGHVEEKLQLAFYEEQRIAIEKFVSDHDLFVALPTSFGKSLIFQSMPLIFDYLRHQTTTHHSIAIVISPLTSLTEDQICRSEKLGLKAVNLSSVVENSVDWQSVIKGEFSIFYSSPETILSDKGTKLRPALASLALASEEAFGFRCYTQGKLFMKTEKKKKKKKKQHSLRSCRKKKTLASLVRVS